ncbi:hypothetical protein MPL1032_370024 [Mesorhizobium plurifarium]|uniref:DUF2188 domain-containing protein n=1 Tax=Mesorhizobium plurifarium TaxID=69974 RepID=A0A0K2W4J8_MESPL|nr:hypothetical protein MPL1032_370024 [Mesorhizobium plurifarium]
METSMPSSRISPVENVLQRFVVGRDGEGRWIARDEEGHAGGVFADRAAAVHFAMVESGHRADAIRFATSRLSLFG